MTDLFLKVLDMSITASWVILAVMAVRLLLRKAPKKYSYALWVAALFRLLCPVSLQSVVSAFNFKPFRQAAQSTGELQFIPRDVVIPSVNTEIPAVTTTPPVADAVIDATMPIVDNPPLAAVTPEISVNPMQILLFAGMIIWLVGMAAMVTVSVVNYIRLRKDLRFATRMEGNIWQCETVRSPFLVGLIKPKIYLPYGLDGQTQEYILAHEQYHLKRFDHIAKLLGYAALTLHWFNPLCHLAFRLMNSDMEMSCDEYVLDRNNIPTTQYSYSLLTIATNRRFPAATPLAFAESGVKERMINVLKWKKPKKWVSVVAVMVCTILLISCATNPKVNKTTTVDLQVNDPAMLEFPGVKWFVTPEELKEALNITEEQILSEYIDSPENDEGWDYDTYYLSVTDLVLFDREVTYANFQFRRDPGYDFGFDTAMVMFAEDTDMQVLKEELTDIYGPGVGSEYEYSVYGQEEMHHVANCSKMEDTLKYMAYAGYRYMDDLEGNPYKDALESPEHMHYIWAATTGGFLETYGVTELFKALMDEPYNADKTWLQDDAVLEKMLNQYPWISIAIGNHTAAAITQSVTGQADDDAPRYTNNYMEFNAKFLSNYIHYDYISTKGSDPAMLELAGIKWGATPEDVRAALNLPTEKYLHDISYGDNLWLMILEDFEFFGEEVAYGRLWFRKLSGIAEYALESAHFFYENEADMATVKATLTDIYGRPTDELGFNRYRIYNGVLESYTDAGFKGNYTDVDEPIYGWWQSRAKKADVLSAEVMQKMVASGIVEPSPSVTGLERDDPANLNIVMEYLKKESAAQLYCTNGLVGTPIPAPQYSTPYAVIFDAGDYIWAQQYFQLSQVGPTNVDNRGLLEYPGLEWGMTAEEVISSLNINEEQVSKRESDCLTVKDLTLFGYPLKGVKFYFSTTDGPYANGLCSITAYFTEDTDMTLVRSAMYKIYGLGDDWSGLDYRIDPDGKLSTYSDAMKNRDRLQHYWRISGKVGDLVEDMEEAIAFFESAYPNATRQTIEEYLKLHHIAGIGLIDTAETEGPLVDSSVATKNLVQFNGTGVMWYMQNFGK